MSSDTLKNGRPYCTLWYIWNGGEMFAMISLVFIHVVQRKIREFLRRSIGVAQAFIHVLKFWDIWTFGTLAGSVSIYACILGDLR